MGIKKFTNVVNSITNKFNLKDMKKKFDPAALREGLDSWFAEMKAKRAQLDQEIAEEEVRQRLGCREREAIR